MRRWAADAEGLRDAATLLPVIAAILFLPPFILVFAAPVLVAGIPLIVIYVFGAWAAIVLAAWLVARRMAPPQGADGQPDAGEPPAADRL